MKRALLTAMILVLAVLFAQAQDGSVPELINYQGKLTDVNGNPLEGNYKLQFNIWNQASGGTNVWGPQTFTVVQVIQGHFNVILGPTDAAVPEVRSIVDAFAGSERYLEILIDDSLISPRQRILSAPYAIRAEHAMKADLATKTESVSGSVVTFNRWVSDTFSYEFPPWQDAAYKKLRVEGATITIKPTGGVVVIGLKPGEGSPEARFQTLTSFFGSPVWLCQLAEPAHWYVEFCEVDEQQNYKRTLAHLRMPEQESEAPTDRLITSIQAPLFDLTPGETYHIALFIIRELTKFEFEGIPFVSCYSPGVDIDNCQLYAYEVGGEAQ